MLNGYERLEKLADGQRNMVVPGHDAEVFKRYPVSKPGMEGVGIRLD